MNYFDLLHQRDIRELRDDVTRLQQQNDEAGLTPQAMKELLQENLELKLRLGLLVRLLIQKGIFTAEEFAQILTEARQEPGR